MGKQILEGIKVVEFAYIMVVPSTCALLAHHGAEVVRVETSTRLDLLRTMPPYKDNIADPDRALMFGRYNPNKYGVSINLRHPKGVEVAKRLANAASKTSKASAKVTPAAFVVGSPTVSGTAVVGQLLTVVPGTWSPQPAFSYQWLRNGKPISKAKGATYKLVAADLGKKITVKLTATKAGYATAVKTTSALLVS